MPKASKAQKVALLRALVLNTDWKPVDDTPTQKRTWEVILRNDWFDDEEEQITIEGMQAAGIPTQEQPCIKLTRRLTYNHPYQTEKGGKVHHRSLTFMPDTIIMLTFRGLLDGKGRRKFIEGYVNLDGNQLFVRMYEPMRCEVATIPIPDMKKLVEEGRVYEQGS